MASEEERQQLAAMAGATVAFFRSNRELWKWFNEALDEDWAPDRLLAKLKTTKWFKTHSEPQRQAIALRESDPDEYRRRLSTLQRQISDLATQLGAREGFTGKDRDNIARWALHNAWSESQIRHALVARTNARERIMRGKSIGGEAGELLMRFENAAYNNGVRVSGRVLGTWIQSVLAGNSTEEFVMQQIRKKAYSAFPGLREEIEGGVSVREFADSYIQAKADILELNPAAIDVFDSDIRRALNAKDDKGRFSPLTLTDFETRMRKDPRWLGTQNAEDSLIGAGHEVLKQFGVTW